MEKVKSFIALDFEYLILAHYDTPCAVGVVKVIDGVIVQKHYTLIRPESGQGMPLTPNNGITWEMVENAPTFKEIYPLLVKVIDNLPIVAHNFSTERKVIQDSCLAYGMDQVLDLKNHYDTDYMSGHHSLKECCEHFDIELNHHNALSDAEACAHLFMILQEERIHEEVVRTRTNSSSYSKYKEERLACDKEVYNPLDNEDVENKNTPFFGKVKTVVTGTFEHFPDRNKLKESLKRLGADIDQEVRGKTQILVAGAGAGPSKLAKAQNQGVRIMDEEELLQYVYPQS